MSGGLDSPLKALLALEAKLSVAEETSDASLLLLCYESDKKRREEMRREEMRREGTGEERRGGEGRENEEYDNLE